MSRTAAQPAAAASARPAEAILRVRNVHKAYRMGDSRVQVLNGVNLDVVAGEFLAIEGRSGSGKSTLLHLMGALDEPDQGTIEFEGRDIATMPGMQRSRLRNRRFGFVFQFYHLLPELNVEENTLLAAMVEKSWLGFRRHRRQLREQARELLESLGLGHRLTHRPAQLSGGERQRVAIARALMNAPTVLFADEPTGNLDVETGSQIMGVLEQLHAQRGQTIVMVTHDRTLARTADRTLVLTRGTLQLSV